MLTYKIAPIQGQTVAFAEQGKRDLGAPIGDVKARTKGTVTFTPTAGPGGPRTVIAQVAQRGHPAQDAGRGALRRAVAAASGAADAAREALGHAAGRDLEEGRRDAALHGRDDTERRAGR